MLDADIVTSFEKLDEIVKQQFSDESLLSDAKELMAGWIDSNRQLETIRNISQLLLLLQRRGFYKPEEFTAFRLFKKLIDEPEFNRLLEEHQLLIQTKTPREPRNIYAERRLKGNGATNGLSFHTAQRLHSTPFPSRHPIPVDKRNEIFQIIANGIPPKDFYSLSRFLMVCNDNEIKDIEIEYRDYRTRTMVVLERYELRKNSFPKLIFVLELMRRRDIVDQIQQIVTLNQ